MKMEVFVLLASVPQFCGIFRVTIGRCPFKMLCFWSAERAIFGSKRTSGEFGLQDPKTAQMPIKQIQVESKFS